MSGTVARNRAPVAADDRLAVLLDAPGPVVLSVADLLANDDDPDGDALSVVSVSSVLGFTPGSGVLFLDRPLAPGPVTFAYTVADPSGLTSTATATLDVSFPELPPIRVTVAEDDPRGVFVAGTNLASLGGEDLATDPAHGTVSLRLVGDGPEAEFVYTPDADFSGADAFTLVRTGLGQTYAVQRVLVTVTPEPPPGPGTGGGYLRGTEGADLLDRSGATARAQVAGLGGDDTIRGGAADDALNGGAGADAITGGAGRDTITGGTGADRLLGGAGEDRFVVSAGDLARASGGGGALDTVLDFEGAGAAGGDVLALAGLGAGASLSFVRAVGGDASRQLYALTYDANGAAPGGLVSFDLQVNMAGGSAVRLAASDYAFVAA